MTRRTAIVLVALLVVTAAAVPSMAQSSSAEQSFLDQLLGLDSDDDESTVSTLFASVEGQAAGALLQATGVGTDPDPEREINALQSVYNSHSSQYRDYANKRVNATGRHNVVNVTFIVDGEQSTRYVVATVENGNYTTVRMQDSLARQGAQKYVQLSNSSYLVYYRNGHTEVVENVTYSVDDTIVVRGEAVGAVTGDVEQLFTYIEADEDVPRPFVARLASKYRGSVTSTLFGGTT